MREIKLKYLCHSNSTPYSVKDLDEENTGYPVFGAAGIMGYLSTYDYADEYLGVIKDGAGVGRVDKYPAKSSLLGTMTGIIPNDGVCIDWLKYIIENLNLGNSIDKTTIPHIYFNEYGNRVVPFISVEEQSRIADYLDKKCAEIDALIAAKEKTNALLKERRQSIIYEAVTKGLDPTAKMKDSGIEWVGQIPVDWKVCRIKNLTDESHPYPVGDGDHGLIKADDYQDEGIPYIRVLNLTWGEGLNLDNLVYISEEMNARIKNSELKPNDILVAKTGATIGKTAIVPETLPVSNTTSHVGKITLSKTHNAKYFFYVMTSRVVQKQISDLSAMQSTRPELGIDGLKNLIVTLPPLASQEFISQYLDSHCAEIDSIIMLNDNTIKNLKEYRQSVIYEAVTGKVEM